MLNGGLKRNIPAYLFAVVGGWAVNAAVPAHATGQSAPSGAGVLAVALDSDSNLAEQVKVALHQDPYFYDEHVDVKIEKGNVVLKGFVFGDWDLRNAIRIAKNAAQGHRVINNLTIVQGGRR